MQWSKGTLIEAVPSTCIRTRSTVEQLQTVAGSKDEWKLLCMVRATMSTNTCGICHKSSLPTVGCSFGECRISFQWDELCDTDQCAAFATLCTGIEYTWHSWVPRHLQVCLVPPGQNSTSLLEYGHCFRAGESPHRSLDRLLTFRGSEGSNDVVLCSILVRCWIILGRAWVSNKLHLEYPHKHAANSSTQTTMATRAMAITASQSNHELVEESILCMSGHARSIPEASIHPAVRLSLASSLVTRLSD